jgi:hypothetical protein
MKVGGQPHAFATKTGGGAVGNPQYPLNSRLGEPQSLSGRIRETKNPFPCPESNAVSSSP